MRVGNELYSPLGILMVFSYQSVLIKPKCQVTVAMSGNGILDLGRVFCSLWLLLLMLQYIRILAFTILFATPACSIVSVS